MMVPTVHLNGTSRDELLNQIRDAHQAVGAAMDALRKATPHGRDYYPQGPDAILSAQAEHEDRMQKLAAVRAQLEIIGCRLIG